MSASKGSPRLFILGAGFSVPAGLPTAAQLLEQILEFDTLHYPDGSYLRQSIDSYKRYLSASTGNVDPQIDFEALVEYIDYQHALDLRGTDTWSNEGNEDQFELKRAIGSLLLNQTPPPHQLDQAYFEFANGLRPGDIVITFNYDLILENCLDHVGIPYRRFPHRISRYSPGFGGFSGEQEEALDRREVLILKLHGSIDWVDRRMFDDQVKMLEQGLGAQEMLERDFLFGPNRRVRWKPLIEGAAQPDSPLSSVCVILESDLDPYYSFASRLWHPPMILAPSYAKLLYGNSLTPLWRQLQGVWMGISSIGVIGYSLPRSDPHNHQVIFKIVNEYSYLREHPNWSWSQDPLSKIRVVNFASTESARQALHEAYRFFPEGTTEFMYEGFNERTARWVIKGS